MDNKYKFDNHGSLVAGIYRQNAFYIRMSDFFDLDPKFGDPIDFAVAMHAHEYVHFLHNVSTTAGIAYLLSNLILLRSMAAGCDDQGYFKGLDSMTEQDRYSLFQTTSLMRAQLGGIGKKNNECLGDSLCEWECVAPLISVQNDLPKVTAIFNKLNVDGESQCREFEIGLSFITEGVAYEVDREMRRSTRNIEQDLDAHTPFFPYLAFGVLIRSWSGRELSSEDRISIGISALSYSFSGFGLYEICQCLKDYPECTLNEILDDARSNSVKDLSVCLEKLKEQRSDLAKGDVIHIAIGEYMSLIEAGVRLRQRTWAPEFQFLSGKLSPIEFWELIGSMVDCLILQCKPDDLVDIYWIGPGKAARTDESAACLGSLQSAIHFSQLHLTTNEPAVSTDKLVSHKVQCPFSGGCASEHNDHYPESCKNAPWTRFTPSQPGDPVCWYAAGVKALRNQANASG